MIHSTVSTPEARRRGAAEQETPTQATKPAAQASQEEPLFSRHFPLVVGIVNEMMHRLPPWVERDCLIQSGVIGLLDAAQRYDARRAIRFRTYAVYRIKGEI